MRNLLFLILLFCLACHNNKESKYIYYSSDEERYFKKLIDKWKKADVEKRDNSKIDYLKNFQSFIKVEQINFSINPFKSIYERTSYCNFYDSLLNCVTDSCQKHYVGYEIQIEKENKIRHKMFFNLIGNVSKLFILRYDSINEKRIILYKNNQLEDYGTGYWISISNNGGKSWKDYYTGLNEDYFFIKPKSTVPFIIDKSNIQVEGALIYPVGDRFTYGYTNFSVKEDGILLKINIDKVTLDSDNDGLSDILENKLMTNNLSGDSDNDGVPDSSDCNPRFKNIDNKYSLLYKFLLEPWLRKDSCFISYYDTSYLTPKNYDENEKIKKTYLIVTSDKRLKHIARLWNRYIFVTPREYDRYKLKFVVGLKEFDVSPLFKIDKLPDFYKIHLSSGNWQQNVVIGETQNGWIIKRLGSVFLD